MSLLQHAVFTKLDWAIILATQYHSDTVDKGGEPYIFHPLRVMLAMRGMHGGGEESQIVAVLHDVVEESRKHKRDQLHLSEIHSRFGKRIHDAIDAITRRPDETYKAYILRCKANDLARWVKLADLHDNLNKDRIPSCQHDGYASLWRRYEEAVDMLISE
jgi:(p)ppGpp synthase/HD superfamily hydrolase